MLDILLSSPSVIATTIKLLFCSFKHAFNSSQIVLFGLAYLEYEIHRDSSHAIFWLAFFLTTNTDKVIFHIGFSQTQLTLNSLPPILVPLLDRIFTQMPPSPMLPAPDVQVPLEELPPRSSLPASPVFLVNRKILHHQQHHHTMLTMKIFLLRLHHRTQRPPFPYKRVKIL